MTLIESYLATDFQVYPANNPTISIRTNQKNTDLDVFLGEGTSWAFITAWNPNSKLLEQKENNAQNKLLEQLLSEQSFTYHKAAGIPANDDWAAEESFLIIDITQEGALAFGKQFGQNAIVWGKKGQEAKLLFCLSS